MRNKAVITLVVLLCLGVVIGLVKNQRAEADESWFLQDAISAVLAPIDSAAHSVSNGLGGVAGIFRSRSKVFEQNKQFSQQIRELTMENARLRELAHENASLRQALKLDKTQPIKSVTAEIVSRKESSWFYTATVNRGAKAGVQRGGAVYNHIGLVGQVMEVNPLSSQIVSLCDPSSAVGGVVQRSRSSGVVQGQGADYLVLAYLPKDADVKIGDVVVSSGIGRVIPKGLPIGRVIKVVTNSVAGTTSALLEPSVSFDQVEQVFIAETDQEIGQ